MEKLSRRHDLIALARRELSAPGQRVQPAAKTAAARMVANQGFSFIVIGLSCATQSAVQFVLHIRLKFFNEAGDERHDVGRRVRHQRRQIHAENQLCRRVRRVRIEKGRVGRAPSQRGQIVTFPPAICEAKTPFSLAASWS